MPYDLSIKNGCLVSPEGVLEADIAIQGEQIAAIGKELSGTTEIDATGRYVLPGAIDGHIHLDNPKLPPEDPPTADSFASGSVAAAFGGVTTIIDFAQPRPGESLIAEIDRRKTDATDASVIDYGLHLNLRDPDPARLTEIPAVFDRGVPSFKLYMAYDGYRLDDTALFRAMEAVAAHNGLVIMHAENDDINVELKTRLKAAGKTGPRFHKASHPAVMEAEAIHRALALGELTGVKVLIFHISCQQGVREVRLAKARGQKALGETCSHYLAYTDEIFAQRDDDVVRSLMVVPPIRSQSHQDALWDGLTDGTLDIVSTDHCPRPKLAGRAHQAHGAAGIETRLALVHELGVRSGRFGPADWVRMCCSRPAEIFGLSRKGRLAPGYDADIVIFDPEKQVTFAADTLHSPLTFSSYENITVRGYPMTTISRGELIVDNGQLLATPGRGRFIARSFA